MWERSWKSIKLGKCMDEIIILWITNSKSRQLKVCYVSKHFQKAQGIGPRTEGRGQMVGARWAWGIFAFSPDFFFYELQNYIHLEKAMLTHLFSAHNGDAVCVWVCVRASCCDRCFRFDDVVFLCLLVIVLTVIYKPNRTHRVRSGNLAAICH